MRTFKRMTAALLTVALALSLTVLPSSAAPGSFTDVSDANTALNADILRLMGVVSGTGGNVFNPSGKLTRAQFCTMVVTFLQKSEEAPRYATRTIFSDVRSSHWARAYINLAASISVAESDGENSSSIPLVSGVGDGRFLPDDNISMAEAVTILLRALGYTGKEAGAVWPQGYMDLAQSVGLTENLDVKAGTAINRAQAAQLFVNALRCKTAKGEAYYKSLGTVADEQNRSIILAVNVETDDGTTQGAIRTTSNKNSEAFLPAHGDGNVTALQGKRGWLVLNDKEEITAFVPDGSTPVTLTLNGDAQPGFVKADGGKQYTISGSTPVFASGSEASRNYSEAYSSLTSGTQVTLYSEKGKIVAVYSTSGTTTVDSDAVVVLNNATTATFHRLTGGVTNFNIIKDRQPISLSQIKPYDVVTYDQISNTLVVSDLRMTAVYTDPQPNPKAPTTLSLLGKEMTVLDSAWDTIGDIKPGDNVSLLLTADGNVAGIVKPSAQTRSTAIGTATSGGVTVFLPNGGTMELSGKVTNASSVTANEPVVISAARDGFTISRLPTSRPSGAFDVAGLKLGDLTVSSSVRIYEQVKGGAMRSVDRGSLTMASIPADKITSYHANSSGVVDYIILGDVTGTAYIYGMMVSGYEETKTPIKDENGNDNSHVDWIPTYDVKEWNTWHLRSGSQEIEFARTTTYKGRSGDMVGVVLDKDRDGNNIIKSVIQLTEIHSVKADAFFDSQGTPYVNIHGQTYRIANDVECYYNRTGNLVSKDNWLSGGTGASRFASIRTYSETFSIYLDPVGKEVRVITAD